MTLRLVLLGLAVWVAVSIPVAVLVGRLLAHRAKDYPVVPFPDRRVR